MPNKILSTFRRWKQEKTDYKVYKKTNSSSAGRLSDCFQRN